MSSPTVDAVLLRDLHGVDRRHLGRIVVFAIIYLTCGWATYQVAELQLGLPAFLACLPLYLLAAASLHGISLFTHEGVHGLAARNRHLNRLISVACALPVGQNFAAYRVLHLKHHRHLGQESDPDHYPNYTRWTTLEFLMQWGRLILGYPVYIAAIPILGFAAGTWSDRAWIVTELLLLALLVGAALTLLPAGLLLHAWLIPMLFINTMVNIRGMSQHTLLEHHSDAVLGTRSILTNRVTAFFMCNENYHLEHHLYPGVPWYNLPRLHAVLKEQLVAQGAPFIPSYFAFVREFVTGSWSRVRQGRPNA